MNEWHNLIQELMVYVFELGYNGADANKNICCVKGEGKVDQSTVSSWFKKFSLGSKKLDDQKRSGRFRSRASSRRGISSEYQASSGSNSPE